MVEPVETPTSSRSTFACPAGSRPPARRRSRSTVIAGWAPSRRPAWRPAGRRRSACTARGRPVRRSVGTPRSSSATAGGGTGSWPCSVPTVPPPTATAETTSAGPAPRCDEARRRHRRRRRSRRARRPRGSARRRPGTPCTAASASASRANTSRAPGRARPRAAPPARAAARRRARCGASPESATSTSTAGCREPAAA